MKIRNGFVSNSSSSSYVVVFDQDTNINDFIVEGSYSGDSTCIDSLGIVDVVSELKSCYGIGNQYINNEFYSKEEFYESSRREFIRFSGLVSKIARAVDEDGDNVAIVRIAYGDEESSVSGKGIRVLESFG